jgi:hypothetical protein
MDESAIERAKRRIEERADAAALDALLARTREQLERLVRETEEAATSMPNRVEAALQEGLREQVEPVGRNLAEIRGLMNQVIRRLERVEGDLLSERHARVDDLGLLVDLITSSWKSVERRLTTLERKLQTGEGAIVYRMEERRTGS